MNPQAGVATTRGPRAKDGVIPHLAGWLATPEQEEVYEATRSFSGSLASDAIERRFSREDWNSCGAFGLQDEGLDVSVEAAEAEVFICEADVRCQLDAVQIHGGYSRVTEQGWRGTFATPSAARSIRGSRRSSG